MKVEKEFQDLLQYYNNFNIERIREDYNDLHHHTDEYDNFHYYTDEYNEELYRQHYECEQIHH